MLSQEPIDFKGLQSSGAACSTENRVIVELQPGQIPWVALPGGMGTPRLEALWEIAQGGASGS